MSRVLIVDRAAAVRAHVSGFLTGHGFEVAEASSLADAAVELRRASYDVAIVDHALPTSGESDLLGILRRVEDRVRIVLLVDGETSAHARYGADDYVALPVDLRNLLGVVQRAVDAQRTRRRNVAANALENRRGLDPFTGTSPAIRELSQHAMRVLDSHAPVLIQGETGTGKGVLARWLHLHGPRAEEALVDINCAGLSREFVESELFGHERGAFTGAAAPKLGLLDIAHRGTAFLDEIGEIDLQLQPRLLKVLEEKRFRRLGGVRDHVVDIRLVAATNRDLARRAREGTFRSDLFYRINTITLTVPPLRTRAEDVLPLARQIAHGLGHDIDFTSDAVRAMQTYEWPGNVRELRNVIERAILISNRARIASPDLRFDQEHAAVASAADEPGTLLDAERQHIERVLKFEHGSVERAAVRLGVSRSTLYQKLRRFGIHTKPS